MGGGGHDEDDALGWTGRAGVASEDAVEKAHGASSSSSSWDSGALVGVGMGTGWTDASAKGEFNREDTVMEGTGGSWRAEEKAGSGMPID